MPLILTVHYTKFLIKNEAAALAALKALNGAITVESGWRKLGKKHDDYYWPAEDQVKLSVQTINNNQVKPFDPDEIKEVGAPLQLTSGGES